MIVSPINYPGNKYRILDQMFKYFPENVDHFVDVFSGGGSVGINYPARKVTFIDSNPRVIGLLEFLFQVETQTFIEDVIKIVNKYSLSCSYLYGYSKYKKMIVGNPNNGLKEINEKGYYKLRDDYNKMKNKDTKKAYKYLYVLMLYSFNNGIRYNSSGEFNLPVGKTDLNNVSIRKIRKFAEARLHKEFVFVCSDYKHKKAKEIIESADFVYFDPPYILTTAFYNEDTGWNKHDEEQLMNYISKLSSLNIDFALSNILVRGNDRNEILSSWVESHLQEISLIDIDYHYRSSSYNKSKRTNVDREVLIVRKNNNEI